MEQQGLKQEMSEILLETHKDSTINKDELFDRFCEIDILLISLSGAIEHAKPMRRKRLELRKTIAIIKLAMDTAIELLNEINQRNEQSKG